MAQRRDGMCRDHASEMGFQLARRRLAARTRAINLNKLEQVIKWWARRENVMTVLSTSLHSPELEDDVTSRQTKSKCK